MLSGWYLLEDVTKSAGKVTAHSPPFFHAAIILGDTFEYFLRSTPPSHGPGVIVWPSPLTTAAEYWASGQLEYYCTARDGSKKKILAQGENECTPYAKKRKKKVLEMEGQPQKVNTSPLVQINSTGHVIRNRNTGSDWTFYPEQGCVLHCPQCSGSRISCIPVNFVLAFSIPPISYQDPYTAGSYS